MAAASLLFMGIEQWFKRIHVYEQYWWKTIYTGAALPIHFWIGKQVWNKIRSTAPGKGLRFLMLYAAHMSLHGTLLFPFTVIDSYSLQIGWFTPPLRDQLAFGLVYRVLFYSWMAALIAMNRKNIVIVVIGYLCMLGADLLLVKWEVLTVSGGIWKVLLILVDLLTLLILAVFDHILMREKAVR